MDMGMCACLRIMAANSHAVHVVRQFVSCRPTATAVRL